MPFLRSAKEIRQCDCAVASLVCLLETILLTVKVLPSCPAGLTKMLVTVEMFC